MILDKKHFESKQTISVWYLMAYLKSLDVGHFTSYDERLAN